jgi:hypothetical protein
MLDFRWLHIQRTCPFTDVTILHALTLIAHHGPLSISLPAFLPRAVRPICLILVVLVSRTNTLLKATVEWIALEARLRYMVRDTPPKEVKRADIAHYVRWVSAE